MPTVLRGSPFAPIFGAVIQPIRAFFALEAASSLLLLGAALCALAWVNLGSATAYEALLAYPLSLGAGDVTVQFTVHQLVNDGLMTFFFLVVGLEIKRELVLGELASLARATLPAVAALGGMIAPAAIYLAFNRGTAAEPGWGIPMATDIAFCIGVLTLLRSRVPHGLTVFVTALAIFDDIGGILVIALFYGGAIEARWLWGAAVLVLGLAWMGRSGVRRGAAWVLVGALLWVALHRGGVHATIAGVLVGLAVPARVATRPRVALQALAVHMASLGERAIDEAIDGQELLTIERALEAVEAPLDRFLHLLHPWVAFGIMPAFALANSGVALHGMGVLQQTGGVMAGTAIALVAGKLLGIHAFTAIAVKVGLAPMPGGASHFKLLGAATVAGIGFTVALFIAELAFPGRPDLLAGAKAGILAGSLAAGLLGAVALRLSPRVQAVDDAEALLPDMRAGGSVKR